MLAATPGSMLDHTGWSVLGGLGNRDILEPDCTCTTTTGSPTTATTRCNGPGGRSRCQTINENHYTIAPLRALLDPVGALREIVRPAVGSSVACVILYGSVARGEAGAGSDVDLAVIAGPDWDGRVELEDAVRLGIGNDCDVVVFTPAQFNRLATSQEEPLVGEILTDGVLLVGAVPAAGVGVA